MAPSNETALEQVKESPRRRARSDSTREDDRRVAKTLSTLKCEALKLLIGNSIDKALGSGKVHWLTVGEDLRTDGYKVSSNVHKVGTSDLILWVTGNECLRDRNRL